MATQNTKGENLREACLREALAIIETKGLESLSLREVSRRLGVSHQAPYKHFRSRDHILAEVVSRAFASFAQYLEDRPRTGDPDGDLREMGLAYFRYALAHPLQYRLMFGTPLPDPEVHPEMMQQAQHAFSLLREGIAQLPLHSGAPRAAARVDFDALFVWSTIHGLSSLLKSHAVDTLQLPQEILGEAIPQTLMRIGLALGQEENP